MCKQVLRQGDADARGWRSRQGPRNDKAPPEGIREGHRWVPLFHSIHLPRILNWVPVCVDHSENWPNIAWRHREVVSVSLEKVVEKVVEEVEEMAM